MIFYGFMLILLFVLINAQNDNYVNNVQPSVIRIAVNEYQFKNSISVNISQNELWPTTSEQTLIRVTRLNANIDESSIYARKRRQILEILQTAGIVINIAKSIKKTESGDEIFGMAKKVAIGVLVVISLCFVCCCVTVVLICVKCCCNGNNRKRNQIPTTIQVPQPIYIQTNPSSYQPYYYQQRAPQSWNSIMVESPENRPMLPQPSAPPPPNAEFSNEHAPPPSYEKLYTKC